MVDLISLSIEYFCLLWLYIYCLILWFWLVQDWVRFVELNVDLLVMEFFLFCLDCVQSDVLLCCIDVYFVEYGFGWWVLQVKGGDFFIGYVGLEVVDFDVFFVFVVVIGWCFVVEYWVEGFVYEVVEVVLSYVFDIFGLDQVVVFIVLVNENFLGLMECLGMYCDFIDDFEYFDLFFGYCLWYYVLYWLMCEDWFCR